MTLDPVEASNDETARSAGNRYAVTAVRYASVEQLRSQAFYRYELYDEPDSALAMDYFFWILRDEDGRHILVDCGFEPAGGRCRGRHVHIEPAAALAALSVDPSDVLTIIVTHLHYDHIGNLGLFPNAQVIVAQAELDFWTGPLADRAHFAALVEAGEIAAVVDAIAAGRGRVFTEETTVAPGLRMQRVGGHTPGQSVVVVDTVDGEVVLCSDVVHFYEELERDRPFALFTELSGMYRGYDAVRALGAGGRRVLVAGHDPLVATRVPAVAGHDFAFLVAGR